MDREIWLERMTWPEIQLALADGYDTAVVFTGSIEQHGPHLPVATDTLLGYALGERVARKLGRALLAPVIRPGLSEHHMAFKGTITISVETFKGTVHDYVHSLARHGFRCVAVTWSHGGNAIALSEVLPLLAAELPQVEILGQTDVREFFKAWIPFAAKEGVDLQSLGIHAGEGETSLMLAYAAGQVRRDAQAVGFMGDLITAEGLHAELLRQGLHHLTDNGVLGDARHADGKRGERYLELLANFLVTNLRPITP